jgi:hypothetical protein
MRSLWDTPGKKTSCTLTEQISHEEEGSPVQSLEEPDVIFWESTELHNVEDCPMIHGVEGILNIKEEHYRETLGPALSCQETLQLTQLALGATIFTKSLLCILQESVILKEACQPLINDIHKYCEFCTDTRYWTKL